MLRLGTVLKVFDRVWRPCWWGWFLLGLLFGDETQAQSLVISELMTVNRSSLADEDGDHPDWIELYNPTEETVSLGGVSLSDDPAEPRKWVFAGGVIRPGERTVVFCSGKDRQREGNPPLNSDEALEPSDLDGLLIWLDAAANASLLTERGSVLLWQDRSGQGNHAAQSDGALQPKAATFLPEGLPVVRFDGDDDFLRFPSLSTIRTLFWVGYEAPEATTNWRPLIGHDEAFHFHRGDDQAIFSFKHTRAIQRGQTLVNGNPVDSTTHRLPPGLNLLSVVSTAPLRANLLASDRLLVDRSWHGGVGEILAFDRPLSAEEIQALQTYLMRKWRLPMMQWHTDFRLRGGTEAIGVFDPEGAAMDVVAIPEMGPDQSVGREAHQAPLRFFADSSPGLENSAVSYQGWVAAPVPALPAGYYPEGVRVSAPVADPQAEVRFTQDGSVPTLESPLMPDSVQVEGSVTLRWRAFRTGFLPSEIVTASYWIEPVPSLPQIALTTDPENLFDTARGIYVRGPNAGHFIPHFGANFWREWERPVQVEYFDADGQLALSQAAGIKIHGGWSRAAPQKSFGLIARQRYGDSRFRLPVFSSKDVAENKQWLLRNAGNDWTLTFFRDALGQELGRLAGLDVQAYEPVLVRLNGRYWGIQNLRERLNEHYLRANFDLEPEEVDFLEGDRRAISGDARSFDQLLQFVRGADPTHSSFPNALAERMDWENFFNYVITQVFVDNTDWPGNNVRYWRPRKAGGRWRWIPFDLDGGFDIRHTGPRRNLLMELMEDGQPEFDFPWVPYLVQRLLLNDALKQHFLDRAQNLLNTTFSPPFVLAEIDRFSARLEPEIARHAERWGGQTSLESVSFATVDEWEANVEVMREFARARPDVVREHLSAAFDLPAWPELDVVVPATSVGQIRINQAPLPAAEATESTWQGRFVAGSLVVLEAVPEPGVRFLGWSDGVEGESVRLLVVNEALSLVPRFEPVALPPDDGQPRHVLAERPYVFESLSQAEPEISDGSLRLLGSSVPDPRANGIGIGPWNLPLDLSQGSRFRALGADGIAMRNTGVSQEGAFGYVGGVELQLNLTGVQGATLAWTAEQLSPGQRRYGLRLQYRVGNQGTFQDWLDSDNDPVVFETATSSAGVDRFEGLRLPTSAWDQPLVSVRWLYHQLDDNQAGDVRPEIRLDNIVFTADGQSLEAAESQVVINEILYHPQNGDPGEEYIELYNRGDQAVSLAGWRLDGAVDFMFPEVSIAPREYVVVAANAVQLARRFPNIDVLVGNWEGRLSNQSEEIELVNARDERVDRVHYADEGDWAVRVRGKEDNGYRGWRWSDAHDGEGYALELVAPSLSNRFGQNWEAGTILWGTPGQRNTRFQPNGAPLITEVSHFPIIPSARDAVTVRGRIRDEHRPSVLVELLYRVDPEPEFRSLTMWDDGSHGDGAAGDGVYAAQIPPQENGTVVAFFVRATDAAAQARVWPRFAAESEAEIPAALFQVDDRRLATDVPMMRVIMTAAEEEELARIGLLAWNASSDAQMNATFVSVEGANQQVRYGVGFRLRGSTSRNLFPKNRRVNFRSDDPWKGKTAVIFNAVNVPSQVLGSLMFRLAGVPASSARPVRLLENGGDNTNSESGQFGRYVQLEALDDVFVARQFPDDDGGNLYRPSGNGNLDYLGEEPAAYQQPGFYRKATNVERNDWSDLIALTQRLAESPDSRYVAELGELADLDRWISYFAVDTLLANSETSFANGGAGDYALYSDASDRRFYLIAYDLDSLWAASGNGSRSSLFRAGSNPAANRFLKHPEIARRYHARLRELADTVFHPDRLSSRIDQALGWVTEAERERLKQFASARRDFVLAASHQSLTVDLALPFAEPAWLRYYQAPGETVDLAGGADPVTTREVRVNEVVADWQPWSGRWAVADLALHPGVNECVIEAEAFDGSVASVRVRIFRDGPGRTVTESVLSADTVWAAADSPIVVNQTLVVPPGRTLTIEPGTAVEFNRGATLSIGGRLVANGRPGQRIYLSRNRRETARWGGLQFDSTTESNEVNHVTLEWTGSPSITLSNSVVSLRGLRWSGAFDSFIRSIHSSMALRDSVIPESIRGEPVTGFGVPDPGFWILEGNEFVGTRSGGDIVDFSGGRAPDSVLQVLGNTFLSGPDDGLDLDGATAFVDGNVFMNFRKANSGTGDAHAISTGWYENRASDLTITRNVFVDNEHALLMKEGAVAVLENNTFVRSLLGTVNFSEAQRQTLPPDRLVMRHGIVWESPLFRHFEIAQERNPGMEVRIEHTLQFPEPGDPVTGVAFADPLFVDPNADYRLRPESPARGVGEMGRDLGAYVSDGVLLAGEPPHVTSRSTATLHVSGPGWVAYRYRLNDGPYGEPSPLTEPIALTNLTDGSYLVEVIGRNVAGVWQATPTRSRTWFVNRQFAGIRINEVLARNRSAWAVAGEFPDYIEFYNAGEQPYDLSRKQLSDEPEVPNKFVFPNGTVVQPGEYLVVHAGTSEADGLWTGFGLDGDGDGVYLRDRFSQGERLIDSVEFGRQLVDRSLNRTDVSRWAVGQPTTGFANQVLPIGSPTQLVISEWLPGGREGGDFVELHNPGRHIVDYGGMTLSKEPTTQRLGPRLPFLSFIDAGEYLAFGAGDALPPGSPSLGFRLSAEEGMIGLFDSLGFPVDQVSYDYQLPGTSWERVSLAFPGAEPRSVPTPGDGIGSGVVAPQIILSEIVADNRLVPGPNAVFPDWVELHNRSANDVSLAGYALSDDPDELVRWRFPSDAVLAAGERRVIWFDDKHPAEPENTGFGLNDEGDAVLLSVASASGRDIVDQVTFGIQAPGLSLSRDPAGDGWHPGTGTPGEANQLLALGNAANVRINEWMARPESGSDWFELYNAGDLPVALDGLFLSDDPARPDLNPLPPLSFLGTGIFGYLVFDADGQPNRGGLHVDFRLSADGEFLGLFDAGGQVLDQVRFAGQERGLSEGRLPDGSDVFSPMVRGATRGRANFLDADNDAMADEWEIRVGLDPTLSDGLADADADGVANVREFLAGTDPFDPLSRFEIHTVWAGDDQVGLSFVGERGQAYRIEHATSLTSDEGWESLREIKRLEETLEIEVRFDRAELSGFLRVRSE